MNIKLAKIGIIGHGFVGKATDSGFCNDVQKFIVDPKYKTSIQDLRSFDPKYVFVCVPTPMGDEGQQDSRIIEKVIDELTRFCPKALICIKSTVLPSILNKLQSINENIIYNPEFLREKYANEDFVNSEMIILGGNEKIAKKFSKLYLNHSSCKTKHHYFMSLSSASLVKYSINTFLATKVIYFNELHRLFEKLNTGDSWKFFTKVISQDSRVGTSHMDVPGHDGRFGFGGACFPKDSAALMKYAKNIEQDLSVLNAAVKKNNSIRRSYNDLDKREKDQNVSFDDSF